MRTYAVILAGGRGERFWPKSRRNFPKQFLRLFGNESLIQMTARRIAPVCPPEVQRFVIDPMLSKVLSRQLRLKPRSLICEPYGRNTAPAIALAAAYIGREDPDSTMVVLPADHLIEDVGKFQQSVRLAVKLAQKDYLVTFGIPPTRPDTGYGYIEIGKRIAARAFEVERFREKPKPAQARSFVKQGRFWWNSGMFVWRTDVFLAAVELFMPEFYRELMAFQCRIGTAREHAALERLYARVKPDSVDYAIMEKARNVAVVRADFDWDDVGSWTSLERHFPCDSHGNVKVGTQVAFDSRNCTTLTDEGVIALIGCDDLVVVRAPDAVLVCRKEKAGDIKKLLAHIAERPELKSYL